MTITSLARADGHAGHHAHHAADPDVVADGDGKRVLELPAPKVLVQRMARCIEAALRGDEHVVPDRDLRLVQDDAVGIDEDIVPPATAASGRARGWSNPPEPP